MKKDVCMIPIPSSINYMWGIGSLLGFNLAIQISTGVVLAMNYVMSIDSSFESVQHICQDVEGGWLTRSIHANGASSFFVLLYLHIGRGMYYGSYKSYKVWLVGMGLFFVSMGVAFLGYVLPWGQMSLWGATVITNLMSAVPYVGTTIMVWLWGGYSIGTPTLVRFFCLHFIMPFVILGLVLIHLVFLHEKGSSNPLGVGEHTDKVSFHPYFSYKDLVGVVVFCGVFAYVCLINYDLFMDPDNFTLANPLVTPAHIKPEWYFLFAYAVLRSVPSKLGGVVALFMSIMVLCFSVLKSNIVNSRFDWVGKTAVTTIFATFSLLTWVGAMPAVVPFVMIGKILSVMWFMCMVIWLLL